MYQSSNHRPLSQVLTPDNIPEELSFLEQGIEALMPSVILENFQRQTNSRGDLIAIFANMAIFDDASLEIPGTGLNLVFHDSSNQNKTTAPLNKSTPPCLTTSHQT